MNFANNFEITEAPLSLEEIERLETAPQAEVSEQNTPAENKPQEIFDGLLSPSEMVEDIAPSLNTQSNAPNTPQINASGIYVAFVKEFLENNGIDVSTVDLSTVEDSAKGAREFISSLYEQEVQEQISSYKEEFLTPLQKKFVSLIENGATEKEASEIMYSYKTIDGVSTEKILEDDNLASTIYKEYLKKTTKFSEDRIKKEIDQKVQLGTINDETVEILEDFKSILKSEESQLIENKQKEEENRRNQLAQQAKELQTYLEETEAIGDIKLNATLKKKWKSEYVPKEIDTPNGKVQVLPIQETRSLNPTEFDALLRFYHAIGLFKYNNKTKSFSPDLSSIKAIGKNETLNDFSKALESQRSKEMHNAGATFEDVTTSSDKNAELEKWKEFYSKYSKK